MKKICYIVSTLKRSGPTIQLYNLINYIDKKKFKIYIITLSPEPKDSEWDKFAKMGIQLHSIQLSRFSGLFFMKSKLLSLMKIIKPDLIHTQGIRADALLASIRTYRNIWCLTSHNYPLEDYPAKFGKIIGNLMANIHLKSMRSCRHIISCSKSISQILKKHKIDSTPIQNGCDLNFFSQINTIDLSAMQHPIFISVGSLIKRKNMRYVIEAFNIYSKQGRGTLYILGDGPELNKLKSITKSERIIFTGNVSNVIHYLKNCDVFISASFSEGLPNTVLEALAVGMPTILSNIPSHQEIQNEVPDQCKLFSTKQSEDELARLMLEFETKSLTFNAIKTRENPFTAQKMSEKYQMYYTGLMSQL